MKLKDNTEKFKIAHMQVAQIYGNLSSAKKLKVGCIIVKEGRIISIGYNGMPSGWNNECEFEDIKVVDSFPIDLKEGEVFERGITEHYISKLISKPEVLHAETNAIAKLARTFESGEGAYLFCTHAPCLHCSKLIYQSGIAEVYYGQEYRDEVGINFLKKCNIKCERVKSWEITKL